MRLADIQDAIRQNRILAGPHAASGAGVDLLTLQEVWAAVLGPQAEIIEDYPDDPGGPSCLIYCEVNRAPEHVVVAYPCASSAQRLGMSTLAFMITCYCPDDPRYRQKWSPDFKTRI